MRPVRSASRRRTRLVVAGMGTAVAAVAALVAVRGLGDDSAQQADGPELTAAIVEQRELAEYLEISGTLNYARTVTLTAQSSGVLLDLAPEGTVVRQGEPLYRTISEPTTAEAADALARLASARNSLVAAQEQMEDALAGPTESDIAAAGAAVTDAREARDSLIGPPSEAEIASAEAAVETASEALDTLLNPSAAARAEARSRLSGARSELEDLLGGASQADLDSARAAVLAAEADLADLRAGASRADIDSARAAVPAAEADLADLRAGASRADIDSARAAVEAAVEAVPTGASDSQIAAAEADVELAVEALADLRAGPSDGEIAAARAAVLVAEDAFDDYYFYDEFHPERASREADLAMDRRALADLLAGASEAELDGASAAVLVAQEALADLLAGASEAELDGASAAVLVAQEALADLLAGASEAELDGASAAVLVAQEALADLLAGASEAELDGASAAVQTAAETLETLENPTASARLEARAQLAAAEEALADLLAGPSPAEIDKAEADILLAEEALDDVLSGHSAEEIEAFRASVDSSEADVVAAEADLAALGDGLASLVVMYGNTPVHRTMEVGSEGEDVGQLEQNLAELGYGDPDGFLVDGVFDAATAAVVRSWQESTGRRADGTVGAADIVFVPGPVQVGSWAGGVEAGQEVATGSPLTTLTVTEVPEDGQMVTTQQVTASLPLSDRDLVSEGTAVNVELPDGTDIAGTVVAINPSPVEDAATGDSAVEATILLAEPASDVWIGATVDVEITETLIEDALVVPATALLALAEGGYAVEVLAEDGSVRLIGVETGLFVDGDVEVVSGQLAAGMRVVVPR